MIAIVSLDQSFYYFIVLLFYLCHASLKHYSALKPAKKKNSSGPLGDAQNVRIFGMVKVMAIMDTIEMVRGKYVKLALLSKVAV